MPKRKVELSWKDLEDILREKDLIHPGEEIGEITLVKPRILLIWPRERR